MYLRHGDITWGPPPQGSTATAIAPVRGPIDSPLATQVRLPRIHMYGVRLHAVTEQFSIEYILSELAAGRGGVVVTPNLDHIRRCQRDLSFAALVAEADLVVADGMPVVWASRLQGTPLPQRVAGSDLISSLSAAAAGQGRSIFLLGGDPGTADAAATVLRERYPQLRISGTYCPPVGFERSDEKMKEMLAALVAAQPDIVYVALGSPKQERLIDRIRRTLPQAWWLGVGVSFSFLCGEVKRAPMWMRRFGLEWMHRLSQEPKRLFKRYIVDGLPFGLALISRAVVEGIPNRLRGVKATVEDGNFDRRTTRSAREALLDVPSSTIAEPGVPMIRSNGDNGLGAHGATMSEGATAVMETIRISGPEALQRLRGLVLMAGSVRPSPLASAVGRSVMDLPVGNGATVLTRWLEHASDVAKLAGLASLPVRVLVDRAAAEPQSAAAAWTGKYTIERDLAEFRGTGGLLANISVDYDDDDLILVGNAAQLLLDPLTAVVTALRKAGGVVSVVGHQDGTPSGMMLVTCKALRLIPKHGFVDMKEQALPQIAAQHDVRVLSCRRPTGLPIRSLADYISALRWYHRPNGARPISADPLAEDWKPTFAIVEPGATVAPTARVHDSVVLAGGVIESGAVVVRSVVARNGTLRKDRKAVDKYVTADSK